MVKTRVTKNERQLIVIDGIDQSGKKTQARLLARRLRGRELRCWVWDFPIYRTPFGRHLNAYLLGRERPNLHVVHLLYAVNRWEVANRISDQMKHGIVIANRYSPSNIAYGVAHGISQKWLRSIEAGLPEPTKVIILDVPVETSFVRKRHHRDIHEEDLQYLQKVRRTYLLLAKKYGWTVLDGTASPVTVHSKIWNSVAIFLEIK